MRQHEFKPRIVTGQPEPPPSLDYEWQERQRIRARRWDKVHINGDRSRPLDFVRQIVRSWR